MRQVLLNQSDHLLVVVWAQAYHLVTTLGLVQGETRSHHQARGPELIYIHSVASHLDFCALLHLIVLLHGWSVLFVGFR